MVGTVSMPRQAVRSQGGSDFQKGGHERPQELQANIAVEFDVQNICGSPTEENR